MLEKRPDKRRVKLLSILTGFVLVLLMGLAPGAFSGAQDDDEEQALVRYYVQFASEKFRELDLRTKTDPVELLLLTRRFTLESNADTVQLDTALIKAAYRFTGAMGSNDDTLRSDTFETLQSSFLEEKPVLPALFFPPPWRGEMDYALYPNDPGVGNIALEFNSRVARGDTSSTRDGLFLVNRSTGRLTYLLQYKLDENGNAYSAEYTFREKEEALIPEKVVEHMARGSVARAGYYIVETYVLDVRMK